ncbi:UNVERIFIED_CONTAM: sdhE [Trichonephila clavipes]
MSDEMTLEERKVIYRARRGLKEIDVYFDPYVKQYYLTADPTEKALFAELVDQEDPDLLDWFMEVGRAGTLLRELLESHQRNVAVTKRKRLKVSSIYHNPVNADVERRSSIYQK